MERRISSIQAHVNAVERHIDTIKLFQKSQTVLRSARQRLQRGEELLAKRLSSKEYVEILEELPLPAFIVDREAGCFIAANALYSNLIGYSQQELIGMSFSRLVPDDLSPTLKKALRSEAPQQAIRWRTKRSDGTEISLVVRYRRMRLLCGGKKLKATYVTVLGWQGDVEVDAREYYR